MPQKPVLQKSVKLNTAEGPESFCDNNTKLSDLSVRFFEFFLFLLGMQLKKFQSSSVIFYGLDTDAVS
jgi:hypothetical protein